MTRSRYAIENVDWSDEFSYVREMYGVNPKRGMRVRVYDGSLGTITSGAGHQIRIRLDGEKRSSYWHPTWKIEYGVDA
jgi:hypothetical protein